MKRFAMVAAIVLLAGAAFAQEKGADAPPPAGERGPGIAGPGIDWKLGTVVTTEYKKLNGTISFNAGGRPQFTAEGVEYLLLAPRPVFFDLNSGDSLTVEGVFTTVKAEKSVPAFAWAFKLTIKGKEIDVRGGHRPPPQGAPGPHGDGPDDGPDSQ